MAAGAETFKSIEREAADGDGQLTPSRTRRGKSLGFFCWRLVYCSSFSRFDFEAVDQKICDAWMDAGIEKSYLLLGGLSPKKKHLHSPQNLTVPYGGN